MAEEIKRSDIAEDDVFDGVIKGVKDTLDYLSKFDTELKKVADRLKEISETTVTPSAKSLNELNQAVKDAKKATEEKVKADKQRVEMEANLSTLQKEKLKLEQQVEKAVAQKILVRSKENKAIQQLRHERNKENKAIRDGIKAKEREKNAYLKLSDATRDYKNESKRLGAELLQLREAGKQNTKEYRELAKTYNTVTKNAQRGDAQLKKLDKTVGDNFRSVGAYENATRKLSSALGKLGIAFGMGAVVKSATSLIKDYDQAVTDLSSITQKSAEELKPLNDQARALGESTQFSATEVTQLQIELAKLGFTVQEITDSTGGVANFAAATGVEIPRAAALAGSALRAFNLEATEIDRVVSTLGVATTKTALDFSQLESGLSTVAPVAASFGFSIEDTTALLGQLSNAGFDASSSATATRNILLNLADANGALAKELGRPIKSADDLASGLQELQAKGVDLASALELTDKRSVAAFSTFISGSDSLVELRDSITDVNDELAKMAEDRLDSVSGAMKLLESAWEGFILNLNESVGASQLFQTAIKFIADNLTTIIPLMLRLAGYFLLYTQRARLAQIQTFLLGGGFKNLITSIPRMISGLRGASLSFRTLGNAMKSIPLVAIIAGVTELAFWLFRQSDAAKEAAESEERRNQAMQRGLEIENARIGNLKNISQQIANINNLNQTQLKNLKNLIDTEIQALEVAEARRSSEEKAVNNLEEELQLAAPIIQAKERIAELEKELETASGGRARTLRNLIATEKDVMNQMIRSQREQSKLNVYEETGVKLTEEQTARLEELRSQLALVESKIVDNTNSTAKQTKGLSDLNKELEKQKITLEEIDKLLNEGRYQEDIDADRDAKEISDITRLIDRSLSERLTLINDFERDKKITEDEANEQRIIAEIDHLQRMKKLYELYGRDVTEINEQISSSQLDLQRAINKKEEEEDNRHLEAKKAMYESLREATAGLTQFYQQEQQKQINALNTQIKEQQDLRNALSQMAAEGNIDAKDSIKETIEAEREAEKEKLRIEERKQRMQLISQGLQSYISALESGKSPVEALTQTTMTTAMLMSFLGGLKGFYTGTDNAPEGLAWTQEKGAEVIMDKHGNIKTLGSDKGAQLTYLSKGDKVLNAKKTQEFIKSITEVQNLSSMPKGTSVAPDVNLLAIKKLSQIERAIKNQPSTTLDFENVSRGLGSLVYSRTQGKDKVVSRHYIKR